MQLASFSNQDVRACMLWGPSHNAYQLVFMCECGVRDHLYTTMKNCQRFQEDKHFKVELCKDFPLVSVEETSIKFSSDKPLTIDPGKHVKLKTRFYVCQKGNHLIHFEPLLFYSVLMILPSCSSLKMVAPNFVLIN